ncbi:MAG: cyclase family protein [Thermoanaerobaculia bacterium]
MTRTPIALLVAVTLVACSGEPVPPPDLDLATARIIDLSHTYDDETLYWPTSPSTFELEVLHSGPTEAGFFYSANRFSTPEHGGTHLDAPVHFANSAWTTEQIPLERLIGAAVVIDITEQARADRDYGLTVADIQAWETDNGTIPADAIVLLRTGWSAKWPDAEEYLGDDTSGDASNLHFPAYGEASARFLVEEREVAVLGVDTASIDHGPSRDFPAHQAAAAANVPALENLANLDELPATGAWVFALPMKIGGGSGGPVRIAALVPPLTAATGN